MLKIIETIKPNTCACEANRKDSATLRARIIYTPQLIFSLARVIVQLSLNPGLKPGATDMPPLAGLERLKLTSQRIYI